MKFREAGMAFPSGVKDEGKLIKLYIREFHTKALSEHLILFDIRGSLGKCLSRQKEDYPEKLPRAEFLLRQVLDALLRLPKGQDYHTRSRQWMTSVHNMWRPSLSAKRSAHSEGGSVRMSTALTSREVWKSSMRVSAFRVLRTGLQKSRLNIPIACTETIQDASGRRASSSGGGSSSSSSSAVGAAQYAPIQYDPNDITEVNWAALLTGLGVTGVIVRPVLKGAELQGAQLSFRLLGSQVINDKDKDIFKNSSPRAIPSVSSIWP
ncbi:hypothetical protein DUNSADRAFT_3987 [Dunaliella salina]|uniref:Uncharacterized protein n=1 Tax=Dunaliella salina TaxID=3046 RepID=A0ABQ7GSZ4_DUNSA|nr:hypothetical protein DUNSADRAFT_3987 [Dunaliella salina]KAF5837734.1 hypothetical protein DUNSADRAFT_3987 [Dunaliella salina]KAF5837735.1 hypothetical protein DUNSADRAFT_3987 [Dunaliella salina]|eukprot:KAF5837732.1 hypothetical protein DUNSADRAFT_3987 [Dunaliella salina]